MAAIFAARNAPGKRVLAIDGAAKIGAKILIAGGGRCNVTRDVVEPGRLQRERSTQLPVTAQRTQPANVRLIV